MMNNFYEHNEMGMSKDGLLWVRFARWIQMEIYSTAMRIGSVSVRHRILSGNSTPERRTVAKGTKRQIAERNLMPTQALLSFHSSKFMVGRKKREACDLR